MYLKRFLISVGVVFVFSLIWNSVVHGIVLADANAQLTDLRRTSPDMVLGIAITFGIAVLFVASFHLWNRRGGVRGGLSHGVFFALLAGLLVDANQYMLYPIPLPLALNWFAFGMVEFLLIGALTGWLYPVSERATGNDA